MHSCQIENSAQSWSSIGEIRTLPYFPGHVVTGPGEASSLTLGSRVVVL